MKLTSEFMDRLESCLSCLDDGLGNLKQMRAALADPSAGLRSSGRRRRFKLTTLFLRRCHEYLISDESESIACVTGHPLGGAVLLDELVPFEMSERSMVYVSGNIISSTAALVGLSDRGYQLWGTVHSHPGTGALATTPSRIDYAHHRRLEKGGFEALGIILTKDGNVRFYTDKLRFDVEVIGRDGKWVGETVFKLDIGLATADEAPALNRPERHPEDA